MDYNTLLDLATDLGYELAMSGAETFRVEESINRVLSSYGLEAEVFAIPNYLIVSTIGKDGVPITRMRRIGQHGNDMDSVEKFSGLSRALCNRKPDPHTGMQWLELTRSHKARYSTLIQFAGHFIGAAGYGLFFGGNWIDGLCAGLCGIMIGLVDMLTVKMKANTFFRTIASSFLMALLAYGLGALHIARNPDAVTIGALMILVPGLLFTNAMRDIIYGDTNSGVNRIVQVLLIAMAIALGVAAGWGVISGLWPEKAVTHAIAYSNLTQCLVCLVGCIGFAILFNLHSLGVPLSALGGCLTWAVYLITIDTTGNVYLANFWAAAFAAAYSELLARIRKFPATSYLVVSLFPLLPGAGIYYTMGYALEGSIDLAVHQGLKTAAIAGVMAVGILLVSTATRASMIWKVQRTAK